ncbi:MAG TPA: SOS response-associated peptidase [Bacilli bacterium]|jgi:putative SOS response-associated peptidase YedK|nr:MAG: putative SOS response-associated peptidase YedK [Tenericutes bacterium ADurb.Bin140]HON64382.1 SOS response-associated peptidase [Bacilli bacterium]HOR95797.1 SOS response-associated peptidase [Bacilli bacterium]HPK58552.1 SOS response-associated peptidase [Bacilli bacterium]HRS31238.1 SOS response-associated peptidase [Bacilli bacterium]
MCGRFTLSVNKYTLDNYLLDYYQIENYGYDFKLPRYNIAPGQPVLAIINDGEKNRVGTLNWGFIPPFAKDDKAVKQLINARAETIATKPSFQKAFKFHRCVILADSFYEWKKTSGDKIPMRFLVKNQEIFGFAGIWGAYTKSDGTKIYTCAIITTNANPLMAEVHDRMPVILTEEAKKLWLNPGLTNEEELLATLKPYSASLMEYYQVSKIINNAQFDAPACIEKIQAQKATKI